MKNKKKIRLLLALPLSLILILTACGQEAEEPSQGSEANKSPYLLSKPEEKKFPQPPEVEDKENPTEEEVKAWDKYYDEYMEFESQLKQKAKEVHYNPSIYQYTKKMNSLFLNNKEENAIYSPINTYMASSMLAETANGDTQKEIFDLIEVKDLEENRSYAKEMRGLMPLEFEELKLTSDDSIWLNEGVQVHDESLKALKDVYGAWVFQGPMGDQSYDASLQKWLNEHTGNLLKDQVAGQGFDKDGIYSLASTLYFKGSWLKPFEEEDTKEETFHGTKGDQQVPFMHKEENNSVYQGDGFDAVNLPFNKASQLWIIRPQGEKTVDDLLNSEEVFTMLEDPLDYENQEMENIRLALPKFDLSSNLKLNDYFKELGVKKAFDSTEADFSSLLVDTSNAYLSEINHACRMKIDEQGAEAAAFTLMDIEMAMAPIDQDYEFRVDQPFLAVLTGLDNAPLIFARVNQIK